MKPHLSSNSSIFANRGDPWVSEREGLSDYGRTDREDPDNDMARAKRVVEREEHYGKALAAENKKPSTQRRLAAIAREMNMKIKANKINVR